MKYIIEIEEKPLCVFDKDTQTYFPRLWRVKGFNSLVFDEEGLNRLEELNSDYINEHYGSLQDEAYKRGINDGSLDVKQRVEGAYQRGFDDGKKFSVGEAVKRAEYDKGLEDAWECVKKLYLNGMSKELFGRYFNAFIQEYSARQAIEMLKAHEKNQADNKIGVGDVVETKSGTIFAVTKITADGLVVGFTGDGSTCCFNITKLTKTGEHHNINEILGGLCDD